MKAMIQIFLFLISITPSLAGNPDRKPAVLDPPKVNLSPCENDALKEIYSILSDDPSGSLAKLYQNTLSVMNGNHSKTKIHEINRSPASNSTIQKLELAYEKYGKNESLRKISRSFDEMSKKKKPLCFFTSSEKLLEENATPLALASSILDDQSVIKTDNVAILWAVDQIMNSTDKGKTFDSIRVGSNEKVQEMEIKNFFQTSFLQLKEKLKKCWARGNENCAECQIQAEENFKNDVSKMKFIHQGLTEKVLIAENAQMETDLKKKIGKIRFNLDELTHPKNNKTQNCK